MMRKHTMPKNKRQFEFALENAFLAGCLWGYGIEHTIHIVEQEQIGVELYLGRISSGEAYEKLEELQEKYNL